MTLFRMVNLCYLILLMVLGALQIASASTGDKQEGFENGISRWELDSREHIKIINEPNTNNKLLELRPKGARGTFSHTIFKPSMDWRNYRVKGRFLFPTEGNGYLGFIYNYQKTDERMDFGGVYVKSNGSYVRVSPHYDGNPSWRLYEDFRKDLNGKDKIQVGKWHSFRLDVIENTVSLYLDGRGEADMFFDLFHLKRGAFGLEVRPGRGEPVWVDDLHFSKLDSDVHKANNKQLNSPLSLMWQVQGPFADSQNSGVDLPKLQESEWRPIHPDSRGLLNTGLLTQTRSGSKNLLYLRTKFTVAEGDNLVNVPTWIAFSSANNLDVWFQRFYRGTVGSERFAWSDYLSSSAHPGARLSIIPKVGENEITIKVYGKKFAAGGFYADLEVP